MRSAEGRGLHLVPFDERLAAACGGGGGLGTAPEYASVIHALEGEWGYLIYESGPRNLVVDSTTLGALKALCQLRVR